MRLDLYLAETQHLAGQHAGILDEVAARLSGGGRLTELEINGVLHSLQILIENAIGKAKHLLKAAGCPVPVSAYDAVKVLSQSGLMGEDDLQAWNAIIGLRNRIVHEYLNLDRERVLEIVRKRRYQFVIDFLRAPLPAALTDREQGSLPRG